MPYQPASLTQLITQAQQDISQRLPGTLPGSGETVLHAIGYAQAGLAAQQHEHLAWISRQIIPSEADEVELLKHCAFWGVVRKPSARASGTVQMTLTDAALIQKNVQLQRSDGRLYLTTEAKNAPAGTTDVHISAVEPGVSGNAPPGVQLNFATPQAGIRQAATVTAGGISGGADIESTPALLSRLTFRVQYPPSGGARHDFERWAREVPGVTRAWCLPEYPRPGGVGVTFVMDNNQTIFPTSSDVARVAAWIQSHPDPATGEMVGQPLGPEVIVFPLTDHPVPFQIKVVPKTPHNQAAVKQALTDLFYGESRPGGTVLPSAFWRTIAGVRLDDFDLCAPLLPVSAGATELLTVGDITWL